MEILFLMRFVQSPSTIIQKFELLFIMSVIVTMGKLTPRGFRILSDNTWFPYTLDSYEHKMAFNTEVRNNLQEHMARYMEGLKHSEKATRGQQRSRNTK